MGALFTRGWGRSDRPKIFAIHGFADDSGAFKPPKRSQLTRQFELLAPNLPGHGDSVAYDHIPTTIQGHAEVAIASIQNLSPHEPVGLIGHSIGSAIAVEIARQIPDHISGLISLEGNLTEDDAYFSGQAANFDDPDAFKAHFEAHVSKLVDADLRLTRYLNAVRKSSAEAIWALGRDAVQRGAGEAFGEAFLSLRDLGVETRYVWNRENTPDKTAAFIDRQVEAAAMQTWELPNVGHWIFTDAPWRVSRLAIDLFRRS